MSAVRTTYLFRLFRHNLAFQGNIALLSFLLSLGLMGCMLEPRKPLPAQTRSSVSFNPQLLSKLVVFVQGTSDLRLPESSARLVEDEFIFVLLDKGYSVASRSDVESVQKEMHFQHSGLTDQDAANLGKLLNVPAVLIVTVTHFQTEGHSSGGYTSYVTNAAMGARLLSVEKGEILWFGKYSDYEWGESNNKRPLVNVAHSIALAFPTKLP